MSNIKFVPNIRFRKFEKRWKTEKLEELGNTFPSLSGKSKKDFGHGNAKYITYMNVFTNPIASMSGTEAIEIDKKQNSVKYGDVLFTMSSETPEEVGMSSVWEYHAKNVYLNSFSFGFRPNSEFDLNFLAFLLRSQGVRRQIVILAQGISRFNISKVKMMGINVTFPTNLFEQQKIGDFFSKLDKLLDLQQQKIDKLELLKKALLQKLFPKHDAKIPELRFKGFEDVWRKHRLKEVSKIIGGGTPDTKNPKYWNGNINWFSPNEIGNSPYAVSSHKKITDLGLKKSSAKLHPAEKTILFTSRAGIGDMAILTTPAATNQGFQSLELNNNVDSYFVYSYGFEIKKKADRLASGSTFLEISKNEMEKITLMFPSEQEQQKIGNLLSKVDQLIELENKKLQNLQQVKKCLLQNMFVD